MISMEDGNTASLRIHEREQDEAERAAPTKRELLEKAHELIRDPDELRKILDDEDLAGPLAQMFRELDASINEAAEQMGRVKTPATDAIRQAAAQMERTCANWMLSKLEEEQ